MTHDVTRHGPHAENSARRGANRPARRAPARPIIPPVPSLAWHATRENTMITAYFAAATLLYFTAVAAHVAESVKRARTPW